MSVAVEKFCLSLNSYDKALLSYVIRKAQPQDVHLTRNDVETILKSSSLPNVIEQANNIVLYLGGRFEVIGAGHSILITEFDTAVAGSRDGAELLFVMRSLISTRLIEFERANVLIEDIQPELPVSVKLTMNGWAEYDRLKRQKIESRLAFMAMQYGDDKLNRAFERCFKPAIKSAGFDLIKLDEVPRAGLIDDKLRVEIIRARFLVADLTHGNPGAYWEAGFAEGLGKPVIYTCEESIFKSRSTHFDTNHHLTIQWSEDRLDQAAIELKATVRATLPAEAKMND